MKVFIFNADHCNGCLNCQFACKDEHVDNDWMPYSRSQPMSGHFWIGIDEKTRGTVPKVKVSCIVRMCQHCDNAPCIQAQPDAVSKREDGLVLIDPISSKGKKELVDSCPYNAIFYNESLDIPQKCTGCAHLLDNGWSIPRCVDVCPTDALRFGEEDEFPEEIAQAELLIPGSPTQPRVYYLNMPKRFIAGMVVDIEADEVVIGALITLENKSTGEVLTTETDEFGDFWFHGIEESDYNLFFEKEGYFTRTTNTSTIIEDKNIGVFELFKEN